MKKSKFIFIMIISILSNQLVNSKYKIPEEDNYLEDINYLNDKNNFLEKTVNKQFSNNDKTNPESENKEGWFSLKNIRPFTYGHLILSFLIAPALSIFLILIDMREDKKIKRNIGLPSNLKVKNEYNSIKKTHIISNKYLFSWFLFKYEYPLTNIIFVYHFNHPRYIRLFYFLILILFNTLTSTVLFIIIANNDIIFVTLIFSLIVSIIMDFVDKFITKYLFEFHIIRREIFKNKLEIIRRYIYYIVKKDILFNSKWHLIRNRMITYYRLCGPLLLNQVQKNKYQRYIRNKFNNPNKDLCLYETNSSFSLNNSAISSRSHNKSLKLGNELITKEMQKEIQKEILRKSKVAASVPKEETNILQEKSEDKSNDKSKKSKYKISKGVESFSFSRYGINNMKSKTVKKIEEIKNRYINKKKDIKFDETMEFDKDIKIFEDLDIESLEGFTYISTDANIDKLNSVKINSNKMVLNIFTGVTLIIILLLVNFCLMMLQIGEISSDENSNITLYLTEFFIANIVINFMIHRVICFFIAFSIPKFYGKKKRNCCYKLIFDLYYEKYIRYLYRIRLLISKYQKEFNFIQ